MLRRLQTTSNKPVDAMFKAGAAMVRGMAVQKDMANKVAVLPTSDDDLYFVTNDDHATGLMTYEGEISSYDLRFENIPEGGKILLEKALPGERYATDQIITNGLSVGDYLTVETTAGADQGKWKKAGTGDTTLYKYGGEYKDGGKTLHIIQA